MSDVFSKAKRSEVMARIRGRGNRDTELALARMFRKCGLIGWRRHQPVLGRPDFIFPKERVAVFVDGCFWHGCPKHSNPDKWIRKSSMPATTTSRQGTKRSGKRFWRDKLAANIVRDRFVTQKLRRDGWRVVRVWEHELQRAGGQRASEVNRRVIRRIEVALCAGNPTRSRAVVQ